MVGVLGLETSLVQAVLVGDLAAAQAAVASGASVSAQALCVACWEGRLDIAQWLHSEGASVDAIDGEGEAPLHQACMKGQLEIIQWLCSVGADATLRTNGGDTPAQLLQLRARSAQLDQQELRSTLACLVRRAQAQGPLPCPAAPAQALILTLPPPCR